MLYRTQIGLSSTGAVVWRLSQAFFDGWTEIKYHYVEIDIYNGQMIRPADVYAIH